MRPVETITSLQAFPGRGAGTDAERRAAVRLLDSLGSTRSARLEPFWCRPNWALAHAWHLALGVVGSLLTRASPRIGGAVLLVALLSTIADAIAGLSPGRLLTRERASQNVVSEPGAEEPDAKDPEPVHLVITANYDAGRAGTIYRGTPRRALVRLAELTARRGPGWLGWVCVALIVLIAVALLRLEGSGGIVIDLVQLVPTVALLIGVAALFEQATSNWSPGANDNSSGVAAAIALTRALDAAPPRHLVVDLVLQGAGDGDGIGLRRFLRARHTERRAANTVVLGLAACGAGRTRWWVSDGKLVPVGYFNGLRRMCAEVAADPQLTAAPFRGRGQTPALPARSARLPAIALGALDEHGLTARSHQAGDAKDAIDAEAIDRVVEFGLLLVDRIDAFLASRTRGAGSSESVADGPSASTPA